MADIKTRPAMDKPKALNRDFVPKEAGSIWKQHHDQQEAQRGPKERGSVQYATDQVETTGRRSALAAADGGRRACLLYTSPSPRDGLLSRMPSSA